MILRTIEAVPSTPGKGAKYIRVIGLALAALILIKLVWISNLVQGPGPRPLVDFDIFYIVAQMVWAGEIEQAYRFATMLEAQRAASGAESFMPWTYPPQFDLVVAPLALLPRGLAYGAFIAATLVGYFATLRKIAGEYFPIALIVLFPAFAVTISCGQNGFLTGALIGWTCLGLQSARASAGLPLGLMVIKPHLAVALGTYTLVSRRWGTVAVGAVTVLATSAFATVILGTGIWSAVLGGTREARIFLEHGMYPLFRMVSVYAALYTFGAPAKIALAGQLLVAGVSLVGVVHAVYRKVPLRQALGLTAIASLLISPYAYDYDLPILGIGFALLLPDLLTRSTENERAVLYGLSLVTTLFGTAQSLRLQLQYGSDAAAATISEGFKPVSVASLALVALFGLCWRILRRCDVHTASTRHGGEFLDPSTQKA